MLACKILCSCLHVKSFLYCISGKKEGEEIKITVCSDAFHKSVRQMVNKLWKGRGKPWPMKVCLCFSTKPLITWIRLDVMHLLVTGPSHCHIHFLPVSPTVNQLSFDSWPTSPQKLVRVCESIWRLCTYFQKATLIATPPFGQLA